MHACVLVVSRVGSISSVVCSPARAYTCDTVRLCRSYINGFINGAQNLEQGHLTLGQPEEIVDHKRWQAYHPFSSFLDGVQWRDMPPHGAYLKAATTPSVTLVRDERFVGADAPAPTHEVSSEYVVVVSA